MKRDKRPNKMPELSEEEWRRLREAQQLVFSIAREEGYLSAENSLNTALQVTLTFAIALHSLQPSGARMIMTSLRGGLELGDSAVPSGRPVPRGGRPRLAWSNPA